MPVLRGFYQSMLGSAEQLTSRCGDPVPHKSPLCPPSPRPQDLSALSLSQLCLLGTGKVFRSVPEPHGQMG